jgi:phosphomannomutase
MVLNPSIFKAYDIRARYPNEVDSEGWINVVKGTYTFLSKKSGKNKLTINVSHDMRDGSRDLYAVTVRELHKLGARIHALGLASTPHSYFALLHLQADAAIQITASHNPSGYTGMKCVSRDGENVIKLSGHALKSSVLDEQYLPEVAGGEVVEMAAPVEEEAKETVKDFPKVSRGFKVVADTANGMGVTYLKALSKFVPLDITYLYPDLDGNFPNHLSDTCQHGYWKNLCEKVKSTGSDFGIATDGDADRIAFVDENGRFLPNTLITCLIMDVLHETEHADLFLADIRSILNVQNYAKKIGAKTKITKVGHAFITADLQSTGSHFGGESSGHFFFKKSGGAENAMRVIMAVLSKMSQTGKSISQTLSAYESAHEAVEQNFSLGEGVTKDQVFASIQSKFPDAQIDLMDGISVNYDTWRANIRGSNTEPLLRLNLEAETSALLDEKQLLLQQILEELGAKPNSGH